MITMIMNFIELYESMFLPYHGTRNELNETILFLIEFNVEADVHADYCNSQGLCNFNGVGKI